MNVTPIRRSVRPHVRRGTGLVQAITSVSAAGLLITGVFIPALIGLRDRNFQALCSTRVGLLTRAMLVYASDYDETPPFILRDAASDSPLNAANRRKETWLAAASTMERIFLLRESDWYTGGYPKLPNSGDLFPYARFESIYRCPEFERIVHPDKYQNAFNITRTIFGNKLNLEDGQFRFDQGILRLSAVFKPAGLPMMIDESWHAYVAYPIQRSWVWGGIDPLWDAWNCCMGQYHGRPLKGLSWYPSLAPPGSTEGVVENDPQRSATLGFYDGHCEPQRDPLPNMEINSLGRAPMNPFSGYGLMYMKWLAQMIYAQVGQPLPF